MVVKGGEKEMKPKVFWVTRDKDDGRNLCLWEKKPSLDKDGCWWGKEENTEPTLFLDRDEFIRLTRIRLNEKEIKKCRIEIVMEA